MIDWYRHEIVDSGRHPLALMLAAFLVTFVFIRISVRMIRAGVRWWPGNVTPGGLHVHHVVFGTVFMVASGAASFSPVGDRSPWLSVLPALFGCGAALVLDEFALILHLEDVYWSERGRTSIDAVFLAAGLMGLVLLGVTPFGIDDVVGEDKPGEVQYAVVLVLNGALVVLTLLKGKVWTGLLGVLVPGLPLLGAVRLGRPHSPWARWRYPDGSLQLARARAREERHQARWVRSRRWLQDLLAGRPSPDTDVG